MQGATARVAQALPETAGTGPAGGAAAGSSTRRAALRLTPILWTVFAVLAIGMLAWIASVSRAVSTGADRRNQIELGLATAGLEQFGGTIATLAQAHFVPGRVHRLLPAERDYQERWTHRVWIRHPSLDEFKLVYRITDKSGCEALRADITAAEGVLPFVANYNGGSDRFLKIVGHFPLRRIWAADTGANGPMAGAPLARYVETLTSDPGVAATADSVVCYAAGISLGRLLAPERSAARFASIMILDSKRDVVAQAGPERLPLRSFAGVAPDTSAMVQLVAATAGKAAAPRPEPRVVDRLDPVSVEIAGRTYTAYVRPLVDNGELDACRLAGSAGVRARGDCLVVGLVPRNTVWRQVLDLPRAIGVVLGLATLMLITLMPVLRLILLGPGEAIGRAEAVAVVLGVPAFASIATLALLFAVDLGLSRETAHQVALKLARDAAKVADAELGAARQFLASPAMRATLPAAAAPPTVDPVAARQPEPICRTYADFEAARPDPAKPARSGPVAANNPSSIIVPKVNLPLIDAAVTVNQDGNQLPGTVVRACRSYIGGRANVSARDYFVRLRQHETDDPRRNGHDIEYDHVTSMQDGVPKAILAMPHGAVTGAPEARRDRTYLVGSTVVPAFTAPVLPPMYSLMVIDARSETLPVLVHSVPGRASGERFASSIQNAGEARRQLRGQVGGGTGASPAGEGPHADFRAHYDGAARRFVGVPIGETGWVALISYAEADADDLAARGAFQALRLWAMFSILSVLLWIGWLLATGRRGWPRLWPQRDKEDDYARLTRLFAILAAAGALVVVLLPRAGAAGFGLAVVLGLAIRLGAAVLLHRGLESRPRFGAPAGALRPATERAYRRMLFALMLCLSVVPMAAFWRDAHSHVAGQMRAEAMTALTGRDGTVPANLQLLSRLYWAMARTAPSEPVVSAHFGVSLAGKPIETRADDGFFSGIVDDILDEPASGRAQACTERPEAPGLVTLCGSWEKPLGLSTRLPGLFSVDHWYEVLFAGLIFAAALGGAAWLLVQRVLTALTGFGIPLEAFRTPTLWLGDLWPKGQQPARPKGALTLNRKSLLVNAPYIILPMLKRSGRVVRRYNIADHETLAASQPGAITEGEVLVFTGLELVLADPRRRIEALELLERAAAGLALLGVGTTTRLLILSEAAPLERIIDAFERDQRRDGIDTHRENLRWSRLFEDFATFGFAPNCMVGSPRRAQRMKKLGVDPDNLAGVEAVLEEARWLPARVVNGAIGEEPFFDDEYLRAAVLPIDEAVYQNVYEPRLIAWAVGRQFPGPIAARAHFRNQIIEHYQKVWSSSTHGEHLVLHHLAHGRFVNIGSALAFAALVRRGLVVLDPEPRLLNQSFGMFIRQAEKLDTIRGWQKALPPGTWVKARLPLFATIGIAVALLAAALALSGEDATSLLPVLAAGVPALLAALQRALARQ